MGKDGRDAVRLTATFTRAQAAELDRMAKREGVSVAWLIRRATERFIDDARGGPMLPLSEPGGQTRGAA
jgi:hypothetical protein